MIKNYDIAEYRNEIYRFQYSCINIQINDVNMKDTISSCEQILNAQKLFSRTEQIQNLYIFSSVVYVDFLDTHTYVGTFIDNGNTITINDQCFGVLKSNNNKFINGNMSDIQKKSIHRCDTDSSKITEYACSYVYDNINIYVSSQRDDIILSYLNTYVAIYKNITILSWDEHIHYIYQRNLLLTNCLYVQIGSNRRHIDQYLFAKFDIELSTPVKKYNISVPLGIHKHKDTSFSNIFRNLSVKGNEQRTIEVSLCGEIFSDNVLNFTKFNGVYLSENKYLAIINDHIYSVCYNCKVNMINIEKCDMCAFKTDLNNLNFNGVNVVENQIAASGKTYQFGQNVILDGSCKMNILNGIKSIQDGDYVQTFDPQTIMLLNTAVIAPNVECKSKNLFSINYDTVILNDTMCGFINSYVSFLFKGEIKNNRPTNGKLQFFDESGNKIHEYSGEIVYDVDIMYGIINKQHKQHDQQTYVQVSATHNVSDSNLCDGCYYKQFLPHIDQIQSIYNKEFCSDNICVAALEYSDKITDNIYVDDSDTLLPNQYGFIQTNESVRFKIAAKGKRTYLDTHTHTRRITYNLCTTEVSFCPFGEIENIDLVSVYYKKYNQKQILHIIYKMCEIQINTKSTPDLQNIYTIDSTIINTLKKIDQVESMCIMSSGTIHSIYISSYTVNGQTIDDYIYSKHNDNIKRYNNVIQLPQNVTLIENIGTQKNNTIYKNYYNIIKDETKNIYIRENYTVCNIPKININEVCNGLYEQITKQNVVALV